jgi:hypothetical protein
VGQAIPALSGIPRLSVTGAFVRVPEYGGEKLPPGPAVCISIHSAGWTMMGTGSYACAIVGITSEHTKPIKSFFLDGLPF